MEHIGPGHEIFPMDHQTFLTLSSRLAPSFYGTLLPQQEESFPAPLLIRDQWLVGWVCVVADPCTVEVFDCTDRRILIMTVKHSHVVHAANVLEGALTKASAGILRLQSEKSVLVGLRFIDQPQGHLQHYDDFLAQKQNNDTILFLMS